MLWSRTQHDFIQLQVRGASQRWWMVTTRSVMPSVTRGTPVPPWRTEETKANSLDDLHASYSSVLSSFSDGLTSSGERGTLVV